MSRDDPMDRARAALDAAREARGAPDDERDEVIDPRDPYAAAEAALRHAEEARGRARGTGRVSVAEADAQRQLRRLKARAGAVVPSPEAADEVGTGRDADEDAPTEPRLGRPNRRL